MPHVDVSAMSTSTGGARARSGTPPHGRDLSYSSPTSQRHVLIPPRFQCRLLRHTMHRAHTTDRAPGSHTDQTASLPASEPVRATGVGRAVVSRRLSHIGFSSISSRSRERRQATHLDTRVPGMPVLQQPCCKVTSSYLPHSESQ